MSLPLYDAHNHLQDKRLQPHLADIVPALESVGVVKMVVNGTQEDDWASIFALAQQYPSVIPSFGYHPWQVQRRTEDWQKKLQYYLDKIPSALGEIGLDRWIQNNDLPQQEEVFVWQWRLAVERQLPVSVHCLQAWGRLWEILQVEPKSPTGFLLHSYSGPPEMIKPLAKLGAYFSLPGYFAHERKQRQCETFRQVPLDRFLIETDAPDQLLPAARNSFPLTGVADKKALNHPANLKAVYEFATELLEMPLSTLAQQTEENFLRLFGLVMGKQT